ncbi:MAG TPA: hypothetical protein VFK96_01510 [Gammaproteobacteria bacterium]|nr:hypothetical protein [Gammaproteobacteria bacterium]
MRVIASAPGKLVLLGEYAVLEGAPAVVMAVDRRARVMLSGATSGDYLIDAPTLGIHGARGRLGDGRIEWSDLASADADKLQLTGAVIAAAGGQEPLPPFRAELDTDAFFVDHNKLGLGSSAALTVALSGALCALRDQAAPSASRLIAAHRAMQGGRGSGLDIAASLHGGTIVYRLEEGGPRVEPVTLPAGLHIGCVWSGKSASTGDFLRRIGAWREDAPTRYSKVMNEIKSCAGAGAMAALCGDAATVVEAAAAYAEALAELGRASGADIISAEHVKIGRIAAACGITYKTCGAGGGDIGIVLTTDDDRLAQFGRRVEQAGFRMLDLVTDARGLQVEVEHD